MLFNNLATGGRGGIVKLVFATLFLVAGVGMMIVLHFAPDRLGPKHELELKSAWWVLTILLALFLVSVMVESS